MPHDKIMRLRQARTKSYRLPARLGSESAQPTFLGQSSNRLRTHPNPGTISMNTPEIRPRAPTVPPAWPSGKRLVAVEPTSCGKPAPRAQSNRFGDLVGCVPTEKPCSRQRQRSSCLKIVTLEPITADARPVAARRWL